MARKRTIRRTLAAALLALALVPGAAAAADAPDPARARAEALWREGAGLHVEGRYEAAARRFREALALQPSARAHTWLAWSLSELGELRQAVEHCRRALALDPAYPNAYNDLGAYLVDLGRPRAAEPWLRRAIAIEDYCCPHYAWYHLARARLLQGRLAAARDAVDRALRHDPRYRPALQLRQLLRRLELHAA